MKPLDKTTNRPHSNYFTAVLGKESRMLVFLESELPAEIFALIDPSTFKRRQEYHVDDGMNDHPCDLLFEFRSPGLDIPFYLYLLPEHKSSYESDILDQLLRYQTRIHETIEPRGVIIPVIFYHGDPKEWKATQDFQGMFNMPEHIREALKDTALNFRPIFIQAQKPELLPEDKQWLKIVILTFIRIFSIRKNEKEFRKFVREEKDFFLAKEPREVYKQTLSYLSTGGGYERKRIINVIAEEISDEAGEKAMKTIEDEINDGIALGEARGRAEAMKTIEDEINDGIALGEARGRAEAMETIEDEINDGIALGEARGRAEAMKTVKDEKLQIAQNLARRGFSLAELTSITGLSESELHQVGID